VKTGQSWCKTPFPEHVGFKLGEHFQEHSLLINKLLEYKMPIENVKCVPIAI